VAERFRAGRAFLVGDAAHRFPPTGGLGMNTGIGDVHNLAWKLGAVLRGGAPDALLDTYETERRPVIQANCDESRRNYENMSEVVEAFGVSVEQMRRVDESMRHGLASALPAPVLAWCRSLMQRYGASVLARFHHDPAVRARVEAAVARQRSHFDRIGLDLGYVYARGALVPDGAPADGGHHAVSEYTPSTRPGARWPHFVLAGGEGRSSHALVDYARSTLVTGAAVEIVDGLREEAEAVQVGVAALGEGDHAGAQIEPDGALLLRPDGHVAWRQSRGVALSGARVRELVREAYGAAD
jgi:2,4-dichlorophenol 6-monooxygenase